MSTEESASMLNHIKVVINENFKRLPTRTSQFSIFYANLQIRATPIKDVFSVNKPGQMLEYYKYNDLIDVDKLQKLFYNM